MLLCNNVHILHQIFSVPVDTVGLEETGNKILNEDVVCSAFKLLFMLLVSFMQPGTKGPDFPLPFRPLVPGAQLGGAAVSPACPGSFCIFK